MAKYAAFLRGVNVGGRIIKMVDLKDCLDKAGLKNVTTLLQSGNVIFESDESTEKLKALIEMALTKAFKYSAKAQVIPIAELKKIVDDYPFSAASDKQHDYVIFVEKGLEKPMLSEAYELGSGERVNAGTGVIYWQVDRGETLKSSFSKTLSKSKYKEFNTNRNIKTLRKILATS